MTSVSAGRSAKHFVVDAFTEDRFRGNPAAVVVLDEWPSDDVMQAIAAENNLAETAFIKRDDASGEGHGWRIRWMTPLVEVDLCGHATLAAGHVVLRHVDRDAPNVTFASRSGPLVVERDNGRLSLDFPSRPPTRVPEIDPRIGKALGRAPIEVWRARDVVCVYASADDVISLEPDMARIRELGEFALNPTAPGANGSGVDFVSRFFAPNEGVDEDPVTGSAHCTLAPLWSAKLGKTKMHARQVSKRGGALDVELKGDRVKLAGQAVLVVDGTVHF